MKFFVTVKKYFMGWTARVQFPAVQKFALLHYVKTGSEAQPFFYPMGTGGSFPGDKAAGV
jgi:hypothetical protein